MAFTYPVTLNLENRRCVVFGGGQVAERKIKTLLAQKADAWVVSPDLTAELSRLAEAFHYVADCYREAYIDGAFLVIAATSDHEVNAAIGDYCAARNILVNVIDNKDKSTFTVNAHFTQGDLLIAVSTGGASPALARSIKNDLAEHFGEEYAIILRIISEARQMALETIANEDKRRQFLQSLAEVDWLKMLRESSAEAVEKRVKLWLSSYWD